MKILPAREAEKLAVYFAGKYIKVFVVFVIYSLTYLLLLEYCLKGAIARGINGLPWSRIQNPQRSSMTFWPYVFM